MTKNCSNCEFCKTFYYTDLDNSVWFAQTCSKKVLFKYFCRKYITNPKKEEETEWVNTK